MKRVFLVLLVCACLVGVFLATGTYLDKKRLTDTAATFVELIYEDQGDPEAYKLVDTEVFLGFHPIDALKYDAATWRKHLGALRGVGERRGVKRVGDDLLEVAVEMVFDNGSAEARVLFREHKGGRRIQRFAFDLAPDTELPPDKATALHAAYTVGDALRRVKAHDVWNLMTYELREQFGGTQGWFEVVGKTCSDLSDPGPPEPIEEFAFDENNRALFKGSWKTKYPEGTLEVRMTMRWVNLAWRLDQIDLKRTS